MPRPVDGLLEERNAVMQRMKRKLSPKGNAAAGQGRSARLFDQAVACHRQGDTLKADQLYREVLSLAPQHANAWFCRSLIAQSAGNEHATAELLEQAVRCNPNHGAFHSNLGMTYFRLGRNREAQLSLLQAVALNPNLAESYFNLAMVLVAEGRLGDALETYRKGVRYKLSSAAALPGLIRDLTEAGLASEAIGYWERFFVSDGETVAVCRALGSAYLAVHRCDEAVAQFERALAHAPNDPVLRCSLASALANRGEVGAAIVQYRRAAEAPNAPPACESNLLFTRAYDPDADAAAIAADARAFYERHARSIERQDSFENAVDHERPLRIGYVSSDFRWHVLAFSMLPLFRNHDRQSFELYAYSAVTHPDEYTEEYRGLVHSWQSIAGLSDADAAARIRADRVDILVDLTMHTTQNRVLLFARKAAPVQLCWAAYPGSTGLDTMDYRITDWHLDPQDADEQHYAEASIRLPDSFWCYDALTVKPEVNELPAATATHVTFGCFNACRKVSEATLLLWSEALRRLPDSRLILLAPVGKARERVLATLGQQGIANERVEFVSMAARLDYLAFYQRVDLCLDTIPYNGHTTSLDAFWMGVPVLTLLGRTLVGRAGASLANNLRLPELVARTPDEFGELAAWWCSDRERLAELRRTLRGRMERSPLMDGPRFARNMEAVYRDVWRRWCGAQQPDRKAERKDINSLA